MIWKAQRHKIFYDLKGTASQDFLWFERQSVTRYFYDLKVQGHKIFYDLKIQRHKIFYDLKGTASQDILWFIRYSVTRFFMIWKAQHHKIFYDLKGTASQDIFMIWKAQLHNIFYDLKGTALQDFLWFERYSFTIYFTIWKIQHHKILALCFRYMKLNDYVTRNNIGDLNKTTVSPSFDLDWLIFSSLNIYNYD